MRTELPGDREMIRGRATAAVAPPRAPIVGESAHGARDAGRLPSRAMTGSGSSSRSSSRTTSSSALVGWGKQHLARRAARRELPRHARVPRSRPRGDARADRRRAPREARGDRAVRSSSRCATARRAPSGCSSSTIRAGGRRALAERVQRRSRAPRRVRARAPPVAAARHASCASASGPRLEPPLPGDRAVRSVRCRCFPFTSAPVRGAVRGTGVVFAGEAESAGG